MRSGVTGRSDGRQRLVLAILCLTILLDALDLSITQVALPRIGAELDVPLSVLPWVANAYVLTYGGLLLLGGRLCDLFGRRRVLVVGLVVFGTMSVVAGLVGDVGLLIAARAVQGVGAALTVPAAVAILAATFPQGEQRNRALGVFAAFAAAGFSLGLVAGGALTAAVGWPSVFLVKVPLVALVVLGAAVAVAADPPAASRRSVDARGAVTVTSGLLLVALAVSLFAAPAVSAVVAAATGAAGLLLLAAFWRRERRTSDPLVPRRLLQNRVHLVADVGSLTVLAATFGFAYLVTTYLQETRGYGPLRTGLAVLPGAVLSGLVSRLLAPRLVAAAGVRRCATGSLLVVAAGLALLTFVGGPSPYLRVVLPASVLCLGLGMGVAYPVFTIAALTDVSEAEQGLAAGVQNAALQIGGGLGLAAVSSTVALVGGATPTSADLVDAVRTGALVGAALPLVGAGASLLFPAARTGTPADDSTRTDPRPKEPDHA